jgi:hypothetical protein
MAVAFNSYFSSLQQAAQAASTVYTSSSANNAADTSALTNAATATTLLGNTLGGLLDTVTGLLDSLLGGIIPPVKNTAVTQGLRTVACLMNTVGILLVVSSDSLRCLVIALRLYKMLTMYCLAYGSRCE